MTDIEKRVLIGEFMKHKGIRVVSGDYIQFDSEKFVGTENLPNYTSDWNAIMLVVEEIEKLSHEDHGRFGVYISSNGCSIQGTRLNTGDPGCKVYFSEFYEETKLESTVEAVVAFIEWYNTTLLGQTE